MNEPLELGPVLHIGDAEVRVVVGEPGRERRKLASASDIVEQLGLRKPETLIGNFDRPNLVYRVLPHSIQGRKTA